GGLGHPQVEGALQDYSTGTARTADGMLAKVQSLNSKLQGAASGYTSTEQANTRAIAGQRGGGSGPAPVAGDQAETISSPAAVSAGRAGRVAGAGEEVVTPGAAAGARTGAGSVRAVAEGGGVRGRLSGEEVPLGAVRAPGAIGKGREPDIEA